ncbi:hypothetical protein HZA96_06150 [Candidatus Woesearchaeota archaeon]|nr:hypothetical protein [Candidatus Woesearchaeota archaeon]
MAKKKGNKQLNDYSITLLFLLSILSTFLFITFLPSVQAQEEFSAVAQSQITACACAQYLGTLSLFNTGTLTSHYSITTAGDAAAFTAHNPWQTVLQSGEKQSIAYYVNIPCDYTKAYTLKTQIETNMGYKKELQQQITPALCSSLQASYVGNNAYKNCACTPTMYALKFKNIGSYADIFSFSLDLQKEYYQVSESSLLLLPQEERTVYFYVKLPCEYSSAYTFIASVEAQSTKALQQYPLYLQIDKACYQPIVEFGKMISAIDTFDTSGTSTNNSIVSTMKINNVLQKNVQFAYHKSDTNSFIICANTTNLLPVKIKNPTTIPNKFSINLENKQPWMVVDNHKNSFLRTYSFWLYEKQEQLVDLFFFPPLSAAGTYEGSILTTLQYGKVAYKTPFSVVVNECKQGQIIPTTVIQSAAQLKSLNQTNQTAQQTQRQQKNKQFVLFMGLFLLFMLLLLLIVLLYFKYFSSKHSSEKSLIKDDAFAEENLAKLQNSPNQAIRTEESTDRIIAVEDDEQSEASKDKKHWYQRYLPLFIVLFIVLLLLLLLFFIQTPSFLDGKNVAKNETKNVSIAQPIQPKQVVKNITSFINKTEIKNITIQKPLTPKELAVLAFTNRTLYMNEPYFINLSKNFKDKNNDTLSFTHTPVENISVSISKGIALLQPELDFLGVRKIVFTASDNKGGKAKTPEITLNVIKRENLLKLKQNYVFIFIAILILAAFILFLIFRRKDSDADEEDVEQEQAVVVKKKIIRKRKN